MSKGESANLVALWRAGDEGAAVEIHRRYSERLLRLAEKNIGKPLAHRIEPEDIVQSVFKTFFRRSRDGEFQVAHSGALWQLLVRLTLTRIKRKVEHHTQGIRHPSKEDHTPVDPEAVAHEPTPAEAAALNDEIEEVLRGMESPAPEILGLCIQGYSTSEIKARLGCSRWTVRRVRDRIGHRLKQRLLGDSQS